MPYISSDKSILSPFVINSSSRGFVWVFFFVVDRLVKMSKVIVAYVILAGRKASVAKVTGFGSISYSL